MSDHSHVIECVTCRDGTLLKAIGRNGESNPVWRCDVCGDGGAIYLFNDPEGAAFMLAKAAADLAEAA